MEDPTASAPPAESAERAPKTETIVAVEYSADAAMPEEPAEPAHGTNHANLADEAKSVKDKVAHVAPVQKLYAYTVALTAEELVGTLDRNGSNIDDILANLESLESPVKPVDRADRAEPQAAVKTTEDLLSILEGDDDSVPFAAPPPPPPPDRELERSVALRQLSELDARPRKSRPDAAEVPAVRIPKRRRRPDAPVAPDSADAPKNGNNGLDFLHEWDDDEEERSASAPGPEPKTLADGRGSRIIKKKIIFDPDNPATYRSPPPNGSGPKSTDARPDGPPKKRSPDGPPKKRSPKTSTPIPRNPAAEESPDGPRKKRKMTEIDRLLMDEGAVNMIYELERSQNNAAVPEIELKPNKRSMISISRERRALENKAKIIKNAVYSNLTLKTFRVRKEANPPPPPPPPPRDATPRSSIQSPLPSETSAADAPDESRIIRRHSSSSFSSGGFSPPPRSPRRKNSDAFFDDSAFESPNGHRRARNRKLSDVKSGPKRRGLKKIVADAAYAYTRLEIRNIDNVSHIILKSPGGAEGFFDSKILEELSIAISNAANQNVRSLVITSDSGILGGLDLTTLLPSEPHILRANAGKLLDHLRDLVMELCKFKGLIITGVDGVCCGLGVTLLSLADLAIASERATFSISSPSHRHLPPEGSVLLKISQTIPAQLIREMVFCGRTLNGMQALERGLIARTIKSEGFIEGLLNIAKEIAEYPPESLETTKSILRLNEINAIDEAIHQESILLSEYWCSPEGQSSIQSAYSHI